MGAFLNQTYMKLQNDQTITDKVLGIIPTNTILYYKEYDGANPDYEQVSKRAVVEMLKAYKQFDKSQLKVGNSYFYGYIPRHKKGKVSKLFDAYFYRDGVSIGCKRFYTEDVEKAYKYFKIK